MALKDKIELREFVSLAEFQPPKGCNFSSLLDNARPIRGRVDAILVPEMSNAVLKASSLGGCSYLQWNGFETIMQVCCRDRNRLALQADLLSAAALGIKNIVVLEGEDIRFGDHPHARTVEDLNTLELLEAIQNLQQGKDMMGIELDGKPQFLVGSTIDAGATGGLLDMELEQLSKKIDLGVSFIITTPVFDVRRFQSFIKRMGTNNVAVIPTVLLLKSAGMARYIDRNIRSISIPQEMIRSIQKAPDKIRECVRIAADLIVRLKDMGMSGVLISTVGWEDKIPMILDDASL